MPKKSNDLPILMFQDVSSFEQWLELHHGDSAGIRLQIAKKGAEVLSISYGEALDCALCYGWIDSRKESYDEQFWLQRFMPRGPRSIWSEVNRDKAEQLIANGRMKASGYAAIETAKRNGQWDKAYASQSKAEMPEDFERELGRSAQAKAFYETLDRRNQYAILFRIHHAKTPESRIKRIQQFVMMLEQGEKIYP